MCVYLCARACLYVCMRVSYLMKTFMRILQRGIISCKKALTTWNVDRLLERQNTAFFVIMALNKFENNTCGSSDGIRGQTVSSCSAY